MRQLLILISLLVASITSAQEHPFLSKFLVKESFASVDLEWTMIGGSTCFGTRILRSFNGLDFEPIGEIEGLCGSVTDSIEFAFVDQHPVQFARHYYRLELGVNGFSSIQNVFVDQVLTGDGVVVYPSEGGYVFVYVALPEVLSVGYRLFDAQGNEIESGVVSNGHKVRVDKGLKPGAIYIVQIEYLNSTYVKKIVLF